MLWNLLVYATIFSFSPEHAFSHHDESIGQLRELVPCEKGWFYFREKCYWIGGRRPDDRWSWNDAADRCVGKGGHLVTIKSREEQDFIVSFLLLNSMTNAWIGLNDQLEESRYVWHDGSVSNFSIWRPNEPTGYDPKSEKEDCIEMNFLPEQGVIGDWNDAACKNDKAYICQARKTRRKISRDSKFCSPQLGSGWKFQQSCYHLIKEKKTWQKAEEHCRYGYDGGHLVTILDTVVDKFLNYMLSDLEEELWIGIRIKDQFQQQWSSGWYVGYNGLSEDLRGFVDGYCVARSSFNEWTVVECSKKLFFICETSKTIPPALPKPVAGSHCPEGDEGLRDLGGKFCYFIDTRNYFSWYKANFECGRKGGNLVSIHSKEETEILGPFVRYTQYGLFIGLFRSSVEGEDFVWSDYTDMDFENWNGNEPNNVDDKCGEINTRSLGWNDVSCESGRGFICAIPKVQPFSSVQHSPNDVSITANVDFSDCSRIYDVMVKCVFRQG